MEHTECQKIISQVLMFRMLHQATNAKILCRKYDSSLDLLTSPVGHGVEEAPGGVGAKTALDEGDVVRGLYANDGE